jgi:hypothetical protein
MNRPLSPSEIDIIKGPNPKIGSILEFINRNWKEIFKQQSLEFKKKNEKASIAINYQSAFINNSEIPNSEIIIPISLNTNNPSLIQYLAHGQNGPIPDNYIILEKDIEMSPFYMKEILSNITDVKILNLINNKNRRDMKMLLSQTSEGKVGIKITLD